MDRQGKQDLTDSWVTLQYSDNESNNGSKSLRSSYDGEMERLLHEAQREGSTPSASRTQSKCGSLINSPPRPQSLNSAKVSPHVSGYNSPSGTHEDTTLQDVLPKLIGPENKAEWVWDWSSQPTIRPPKESQFRHPKAKGTTLSLRNTVAMKHNIFSWEFMQVFIPSLIVTNLLAFGIGVYIGKRIATAAPKNT